jgi:hypothetical protein
MTPSDQSPGRTADPGDESVVVLFKGGRLPAWHRLSQKEQDAFSQEHVDLMLSVSQQYRLMHLEGFRLLGPQNNWQRFWVIEFPTLAGAETWIRAEMAPPYGRYGYYEYHLARRAYPDGVIDRSALPPAQESAGGDPHRIPSLKTDPSSLVVLTFRRWLPGAAELSAKERGEVRQARKLRAVAKRHGLIRLELFRLMAPQVDWHEVGLVELPSFAAAEAWMEAETALPHGNLTLLTMHLARKWAPAYFAQWVCPPSAD